MRTRYECLAKCVDFLKGRFYRNNLSMSTVSLAFRAIAILSVLTFLNVMFFALSRQGGDVSMACSSDAVVLSVARYIQQNGQVSLEEEMITPCKHQGPSTNTKEVLKEAVKTVIMDCSHRRRKEKQTKVKEFQTPIITLFTSWTSSPDTAKETVHNNTLRNWLMLGSKVKRLIFTNDSDVIEAARKYGIHSLSVLQHGGGGAPVLKAMFLAAQKFIPDSILYAYVNSDILFTDKFVDSLEFVLSNLNSDELNGPVFMTGQRTNVDDVSPADSTDSSSLEELARTRGILFTNNAEDYFITNSAFPWEKIVDVVVGRLAYDNWLVGHARCVVNATVIDLTGTVLAVHQTTQSGGNFEGFKHSQAHYNEGLFKQHKILPYYETGFTDCAEVLTHFTLCGEMAIAKRQLLARQCICPDRRPSAKSTVLTAG